MDQAVRRRRPKGVGEAMGSLACFIALLVALVAIDDRVGAHISLEVSTRGLAGWGERASAIADVMREVARNQSIEKPLLVFSVVAVVLVLVMVKT
jgi:hypothetical protein